MLEEKEKSKVQKKGRTLDLSKVPKEMEKSQPIEVLVDHKLQRD